MAQNLLFVCGLVLLTLLAHRVSSETTSPACPPWSMSSWTEWAVISGSNCKETRTRGMSREPCEGGETSRETRPCPCTSLPWGEWIRISLDPCEEGRCHAGTDISDSVGTPPVSDCCETRPCENLSNLPCDDSPVVQAIVRLCAKKPTTGRIMNIAEWGTICEISLIDCLQTYTQCTHGEAHALLLDSIHCFFAEMCAGGLLKPTIQTMLDDAAFDQGMIDAIDFIPCLEVGIYERNPAFFHQLALVRLSCMRDLIENAGLTGPNNELAHLMSQALVNCVARVKDLGPTSEYYDFSSIRCETQTCGDPHIETCNDVNHQTTCAAPGRQTYLDIFFMNITGVNTQWRPNSQVTVLTEVTIVFKSLLSPNAPTAQYTAANGNLPADLEYLVNPISAIDTVDFTHMGNRVEMIWPHTGVVIVISTWDTFYSFTLRASQQVLNTGTGILIEGCPSGQALYLRRRRRDIGGISKRDEDEASALVACLAVNIPANTPEMEECIFDVVVSNNVTIAGATVMAIADSNLAASKDEETYHYVGVWSINIPLPVRGKCQKTCRAHGKNSYCDKRKGCVCKKGYHMRSGKCVRGNR